MEYLIIAAVLAVGGFVFTRKKVKSKPPTSSKKPSPNKEPAPSKEPIEYKEPEEFKQVSYKSFQGDEYKLTQIKGDNITLLVPTLTPECFFTLDYCERAYNHYADTCGFHMKGVTIAVVADGKTCGGGCGYVGAAGIEIMQSVWEAMLSEAKEGRCSQIPMYELGRNFYSLSQKVDFGGLMTGFAVYHRMKIASTENMSDHDGISWVDFDSKVKGLIDTYLSDDTLTFDNTFAVDKGIPGELGGADLIASLLMHLDEKFDTKEVWAKAHLTGETGIKNARLKNFIMCFPAAAREYLHSKIGFPRQ